MALFGGMRDARFLAAINAELINAIIDTEIEFFKLVVGKSASNIYGESQSKSYYDSILIPCRKNPETWPNGDQFGYSVSVICDTHATRQTPAQIKNLRRGGNNNSPAYKGH